jgi:hypothetical protein
MKSKVGLHIAVFLVLAPYALSQKNASAAQSNSRQGCRKFVQHCYDWYVPIALKESNENAANVALRLKPDAFAPSLRLLLQRDLNAQSKATEIVGVDYDPILATQDASERFVIEGEEMRGSRCLVTVNGIEAGVKREKVVAEAGFSDGKWRFVNFHYGSGNKRWNLIQNLKDLEAARKSESKGRR